MKPATKFQIKDLAVNGEWNEESQLVLITELGGNVSVEGNFSGMGINIEGTADAAMDNCVRIKVQSLGKVPGFLIPGMLNLFKRFKGLPKGVSIVRDTISVNPNILLPEASDIRVLIQPQAFELEEDSVQSFRERVLAWTEKNAGTIAKETLDLILTIPDLVVLLKNLVNDERIPGSLKGKIALCIAYVLSPVDLIPEILLGPFGLVDDVGAVWILISKLMTEIPADIIRENWKGRPDVLELIIQGHALATLVHQLPENVLQKLVGLFGDGKVAGQTSSDLSRSDLQR